MADNVPITVGAGTNVATDDAAGVHYQKVKLVDGTADSTAAIPGDATNGLDVDVTRVQGTVTVAGTVTANVGTVGTLATETTLGTRLAEATFTGRIGEVQASPTANTLLARVKDLLTGIVLAAGAARIGKVTVRNAADAADIDPPGAAQLPAALVGGRLDVNVGAALPAGTNNIGDVDVLSLPALPTGTNNIGDVDVLTLPALPAGTNNIGDVDVLSLPALPAGTNNIGDVDVLTLPALPAGTNNIGDVDVVTLPTCSTAATTQVASSATSVTLLSANTARKGASVFNDSTAVLYVKYGTTASTTSYKVKIAAGGYFEFPGPAVYTGRVDGIWASANGNAYVSEETA